MRLCIPFLATWLCAASVATFAAAAPKVGELHRLVVESSAAGRDIQGRGQLRVTVWYPAASAAVEKPIVAGPPSQPLFVSGAAASDARWASARRRPVVLVSHGFGGEALQMAWLGTALARAGFVAVAVDHPGSNGRDGLTLAGVLFWNQRAHDLQVALDAVIADPVVGPHLDTSRLGAAGFSLGGYTALLAAGAKPDVDAYQRYCDVQGEDGICKPQLEFPAFDPRQLERLLKTDPSLRKGDAPAAPLEPKVRAVFALAPALAPALDVASVKAIEIPVFILLGQQDKVAVPAGNGLALEPLLSHVEVETLPGVGHYDFLALCTEAGKVAAANYCRAEAPQDRAHDEAVRAAVGFFRRTLR